MEANGDDTAHTLRGRSGLVRFFRKLASGRRRGSVKLPSALRFLQSTRKPQDSQHITTAGTTAALAGCDGDAKQHDANTQHVLADLETAFDLPLHDADLAELADTAFSDNESDGEALLDTDADELYDVRSEASSMFRSNTASPCSLATSHDARSRRAPTPPPRRRLTSCSTDGLDLHLVPPPVPGGAGMHQEDGPGNVGVGGGAAAGAACATKETARKPAALRTTAASKSIPVVHVHVAAPPEDEEGGSPGATSSAQDNGTATQAPRSEQPCGFQPQPQGFVMVPLGMSKLEAECVPASQLSTQSNASAASDGSWVVLDDDM